eukprot:4620254-Prymnesium_polylepis.1
MRCARARSASLRARQVRTLSRAPPPSPQSVGARAGAASGVRLNTPRRRLTRAHDPQPRATLAPHLEHRSNRRPLAGPRLARHMPCVSPESVALPARRALRRRGLPATSLD